MMVRTLFSGILFLMLACHLFAQDIIVKKNGDEIIAKVVEIDLENIKYKRFDNQQGPTIYISKADVFMIKYENGTKEMINTFDEKEEEQEEKVIEQPQNNINNNASTITYHRVEYKRTEKDREVYYLLKVNPLMVFNGDIPVYFEKRVGEKTSFEVGVGLTHMDYIYEGLFLDNINSDRSAKFGYSIRASYRYYPSTYTKALDEIYFGPEIRVKRYNTFIDNCGGTPMANTINEYRIFADFKLTVGYISYISDRVIIDWYGGIGIRYKNLYRGSCDYSGPVVVVTTPNTVTSVGPAIAAGLKLGFGL